MHVTRTEIVVEDDLAVSLTLIKAARKLRTANREKICVDDEHCLTPGVSGVEADVPLHANAFEHKEEVAEVP
jgi:hypothetical protein